MAADPAAGFQAEGGTLEELFCRAALAASALMVDPSTVRGGGMRDRLRAEGADRASLLAAWIEAVARAFSDNHIIVAGVPSLIVRNPDSRGRWLLEAVVDGELLDPGRHRVLRSSMTCAPEGFLVEPAGAGWRAEMSLR